MHRIRKTKRGSRCGVVKIGGGCLFDEGRPEIIDVVIGMKEYFVHVKVYDIYFGLEAYYMSKNNQLAKTTIFVVKAYWAEHAEVSVP
jgi:hypothetical protein